MENLEDRLSGGHPNSLGNTVEVVEEILAEPERFDELFGCYFSEDELVRLRTSNAMKRICKAKPEILLPYLDRLIKEVSNINQASTQWTLAQLFDMLTLEMSKEQMEASKQIMQHNLATHQDWIVLNTTMATLGKWAKNDPVLARWLLPQIRRLTQDKRKSVASRAQKMIKQFGG